MIIEKKTRPAHVLVTGLNGLIGWHLYLECQVRDFSVTGTYGKAHPRLHDENRNAGEGVCERVHKIDLDSREAVLDFVCAVDPEYILHARGICDLDLCEEKPEMAETINVCGTELMLDAAKSLKRLRKFVFISTDHVFSGEEGGYDETRSPEPKHVYGRSKKAAEERVLRSGLPVLIIRPGLVIGESFQGNKGPRDFLFSRIRAGKPTHLFTDEWRTPIPAQILRRKIIDRTLTDAKGIHHLAGTETVNRFELGRRLAREHGLTQAHIFPRLREEDTWAPIRPRDLSLTTVFD